MKPEQVDACITFIDRKILPHVPFSNIWVRVLRSKYVHFFVAGGLGLSINLVLTATLTHFVFGNEHYFTAFLIGTSINLLFNFWLYSLVVFRISFNSWRRFVQYISYQCISATLQLSTIKFITSHVGTQWYAPTIVIVVLTLSTFNYFIFKIYIFVRTEFLETHK
jgi:GtrA-like protein